MEKLVPKLRFPEFEGDWKRNKIKELVQVNPKSDLLPNEFIYIDLESVNNGVLEKENLIKLSDAPSRAQRLLIKDDILYQTVRPYQKNNLHFKIEKDNYVASTGYAQLRNKNSISEFIYQMLHTQKFVDNVLLRCTGTSYPSINSSDLAEILVLIPKISEQQKIASFLTSVDERITLLEKQKKDLELYKKGVMQQLFSQQLRFKDDKGKDFPDWEERKLGEVVLITKGQQLNKETLSLEGNYPCQNGGIEPSGYTDDFNTHENTITISEGGNSCGYVNYMTTKFWCGGHCYALTEVKLENKFLYQYLKYYQGEIMNLRVGSGLPNIQKSTLSNFKIYKPYLEEQQKIATFLSAIDVRIEVVNKQIEQSKTFKKGLLQQLFV